jgi:hypothetical protein
VNFYNTLFSNTQQPTGNMTSTTHSEFNSNTEAAEVVQAFSASIRGKTILITGVNLGGLGFMTAEALVSESPGWKCHSY